MLLEVCVDSLSSLKNAIEGGAKRIELCSNLAEGGTTPSIGLTIVSSKLCHTSGVKLFAMLRPFGGQYFNYADQEVDIVIHDIKSMKHLVDGFVFGALTKNNKVDKDACKKILDECMPLQVTFHRAFDVIEDKFKALEDIIALGFSRILTSGGELTAFNGADSIAQIVNKVSI